VYGRRDSDPGSRAELREPVALLVRENHKRQKTRGAPTDAGHQGGPTRMSSEASVMGVEQRGWWVKRLHLEFNC
jgi:hypothetical protein